MALSVRAKVSKRGRYYIAEIAPSLGPTDIAVGTTFSEVFCCRWAAVITKSGALELYRYTGSTWELSLTLTDTPIEPERMRHLSLTFDQAARPIVAFQHEDEPLVWVRQWDDNVDRFVYRGPFDGVDPVVINDALAHRMLDESDVVLFYLSPERNALRYRIQRETYDTEHHLADLEPGSYLDQIYDYGGRLVTAGALGDGDTESFWESSLYPYYAEDDIGSGVAIWPDAGEYRLLVITHDLRNPPYGVDDIGTATAQWPSSGAYELPVVIVDLRAAPYGVDDAGSGNAAWPTAGEYRSVVIIVDLRTAPYGLDDAGAGSASWPTSGLYDMVVVNVDLRVAPYGVDDIGSATAQWPTGGSYEAA